MLALQMPNLSNEEIRQFTLYFEKIGRILIKQDIDIFRDDTISKALGFFGTHLTMKLVTHMREDDVPAGVQEILYIVEEIIYCENLHDYVVDRYGIELRSNIYADAIMAYLSEWHAEMMALSRYKRSYEEGYRATLTIVKEYWIHQPHKGTA